MTLAPSTVRFPTKITGRPGDRLEVVASCVAGAVGEMPNVVDVVVTHDREAKRRQTRANMFREGGNKFCAAEGDVFPR